MDASGIEPEISPLRTVHSFVLGADRQSLLTISSAPSTTELRAQRDERKKELLNKDIDIIVP